MLDNNRLVRLLFLVKIRIVRVLSLACAYGHFDQREKSVHSVGCCYLEDFTVKGNYKFVYFSDSITIAAEQRMSLR